jgi:DNA-binding transcriptional regulator YiaG
MNEPNAMDNLKTRATWHSDYEQACKDRQSLIAICDTKEAEIQALRRALRKAREFAHNNGWTMRIFARVIGVSATQLSAWTDEIPNREPDFKD